MKLMKTLKPNKARLRKWVKALRSGEFRQGRGHLYHDGVYCCLGVAERVSLGVLSKGAYLSSEACSYFGIAKNPCLLTKQHGKRVNAVTLNDIYHWSFSRIANAIERTFNL